MPLSSFILHYCGIFNKNIFDVISMIKIYFPKYDKYALKYIYLKCKYDIHTLNKINTIYTHYNDHILNNYS